MADALTQDVIKLLVRPLLCLPGGQPLACSCGEAPQPHQPGGRCWV